MRLAPVTALASLAGILDTPRGHPPSPLPDHTSENFNSLLMVRTAPITDEFVRGGGGPATSVSIVEEDPLVGTVLPRARVRL